MTTTGKATEIVARDAERAELRRQWGLLHAAELFVVELHRSDVGYAVVIETALERRARAEAETITAAIIAARTALGYIEVPAGPVMILALQGQRAA
jgi:hypothetical protein